MSSGKTFPIRSLSRVRSAPQRYCAGMLWWSCFCYCCPWRTDESQHVENMWTAVSGMFTGLFRGKKQRLFHVLNNVSGHLRPGTVTLLLAPPGHGKSALLKALSNRIPQDKLAGHIWYGGRSPDEVNVNRLCTCQCNGAVCMWRR